MADVYDSNLQLNSEYTYDTYFSASVTFAQPLITGAVAITSINGVTGPTITFDGGSTGYSFAPAGTSIIMTGAANSIRESSGPQVLNIAAIANGEFLKRQGNQIVGDTSPAGTALNEVVTAVNYALSDDDDVVLVDASTAPVTVTLHNPTTAKQKYYDIKLIIAGNPETIDGNGANIDGAPTLVVSIQFTSYTLVPNNALGTWFIV